METAILSSPITPPAVLNLAPLVIGDIVIDPPLALAPMAGHTNAAFRRLCREAGGCGLVCTELISSQAMHYAKGSRKSERFDWGTDEHPLAVQLFGSDPAQMADAARLVADHGATLIDINMGCWVPKVAKKGGGAGLLRDLCTAQAVVEAIVRAVAIPVTVKVRSGWTADDLTAIPFARAAEQAGVCAITIHARTAQQGFSGQADWGVIRQVKELVSIPVVGNGDVQTAADAARMLDETGCDGVMIGRAALGNPWVFSQIVHELATGEALPRPGRAERARMALRHARLAVETGWQGEHMAVLELRGQLAVYRLDATGEGTIRNRLVRAGSLAEVESILLPLCGDEPVTAGDG
ncbi:MAG: tRNA dihydrouridine synthase DusB [Anaerolineae bacterium]|nr:tRNA dihydrouridine synthase DusB [Anaerolineae bacterium]